MGEKGIQSKNLFFCLTLIFLFANSFWIIFGSKTFKLPLLLRRYHPLTLIPNLSVEECLQKNLFFFIPLANEDIFKNATRRTSFVLKMVMISWSAAQAGNQTWAEDYPLLYYYYYLLLYSTLNFFQNVPCWQICKNYSNISFVNVLPCTFLTIFSL